MKTLLILAQTPELAVAIREALNPAEYQVIHRLSLEDAEPILSGGSMDACIVDLDIHEPPSQWVLDSLFRRIRQCPVLAYTGAKDPAAAEPAYLQGVAYVLDKPVQGRLLNALLQRLWKTAQPQPASAVTALPAPLPVHRPDELLPSASQSLQMLKGFSALLSHSLQAEPMLRNSLQMLREILGVNRAAIFMRQPDPLLGAISGTPARHLRSACAFGIAPGLLEHFRLSFETGIGGYLDRYGRILRRNSAEAQADIEIQKEFELLGAQVAIPMLDRQSLIGIATFDGRVTGEPLSSPDLALVFYLLEELGLAIKNIWLHEQVAANHDLLAGILKELSSGCVIISRDMLVLDANDAARKFFLPPASARANLEFSDLPQIIGRKVYQVLQTGMPVAPFRFQPTAPPDAVFQVSVVPFQRTTSNLPYSALLTIEDQTQAEQFKRLELEAANLRLVRTIAERFAHELNNAVTPLDTYGQLMEDEVKKLPAGLENKQFFDSFHNTLKDAVRRISRRGAQMRVLAQDALVNKEVVPVTKLLQESYAEAQKHHTQGSPKLTVPGEHKLLMLVCDKKAMVLALMELFLNALQANSRDPKVSVRIETETPSGGKPSVNLEIRDNGEGFSDEALVRGTEPLYRTKNVGLGLGLTVAQKVIAVHGGKLLLSNDPETAGAVVRVTLPLESSSTVKE